MDMSKDVSIVQAHQLIKPGACMPEGLVLLLEGVGLEAGAPDDLPQDGVEAVDPEPGRHEEGLAGLRSVSVELHEHWLVSPVTLPGQKIKMSFRRKMMQTSIVIQSLMETSQIH